MLGGLSDLVPGVDPDPGLDVGLVGYPYAIGSVLYTLGAYLATVEIANGNLQLDAAKLTSTRAPTADGRVRPNRAYLDELEAEQWSVGNCGVCASSLTWIAWQPQSRVYLANLTQLIGAILFNVSTFSGLPAVLVSVSADALPAVNNALVYSTSLVGGACFAVAGCAPALTAHARLGTSALLNASSTLQVRGPDRGHSLAQPLPLTTNVQARLPCLRAQLLGRCRLPRRALLLLHLRRLRHPTGRRPRAHTMGAEVYVPVRIGPLRGRCRVRHR